MKIYSDEKFTSLFDHGRMLNLESLRFERCSFTNCLLSLTKDLSRRSTVRDVHLSGCTVSGCDVGPAIFEDCSVNGLVTEDLLIVWGALFRRVTFSGTVGTLKINKMISPTAAGVQSSFDDFRREFYRDTDWALDISNARFRTFDARGIPARLFRLDLETQAVVTRERALQPGWQQRVSAWNDLWRFMVRLFIEDGDEDTILVVPLAAPKQERDMLLKGLQELRDLGVAEPA